MKKNIHQKLLAIIGSIIVLLTINGCDKDFRVSDLFSDVNISSDNEDKDLKTISSVYKDYFFSSLPILQSEITEKNTLKEMFKAYNVDINFDEAYIFLSNYYRYIVELYGEDDALNHVYDLAKIEKPDENSYDAEYQFVKDYKIYTMNIYKNEQPNLYCDSVKESCQNQGSNTTFTKKLYYKFDKIPGDKHEKDDVASWDTTYELRFKDEYNDLTIVVWNLSDIKRKDGAFHTKSNKKVVHYYNSGILVKEDYLDDDKYNDLVNSMYYVFTNNLDLSQVIYSDKKEVKCVLKLIKN